MSALRGAKAQNWNNFIQGLSGAALNSFVIGAPKTPGALKVDEFPNTNPNNVSVPIVGKTPYMENQWFTQNNEPTYNPYSGTTPTMMVPQNSNMGAGATPVTSGLYPVLPQEQSVLPQNWVDFATKIRR